MIDVYEHRAAGPRHAAWSPVGTRAALRALGPAVRPPKFEMKKPGMMQFRVLLEKAEGVGRGNDSNVLERCEPKSATHADPPAFMRSLFRMRFFCCENPQSIQVRPGSSCPFLALSINRLGRIMNKQKK